MAATCTTRSRASGSGPTANEKALAQLTALVAAQQTALDTLAKSLGANPADIAEIVAQAVTAKLDSIDVTFTATSK